MQGLVSVNGLVTSPTTAVVPALDRGLLYGDGVFEALVAFGGKLLDVPRHLARLRISAEALALEVPWSDAELTFELTALAEEVQAPKAHIRLVVTRGDGLGLLPPKSARPNRIVYCLPAANEPPATYRDGLGLKRVVNPGSVRGAAPKTPAFLPSILALTRARQEGFDDLLWTNADGELTESSTANIFFVARDGDQIELLTPPARSGLLLGITRERVIELLRKAQVPVHEQLVFADELPRFDEAFLTSSVRGLVPVSRIDRHRLHSGRDGAVFRHIQRLFLTWTETQLGFRVDFGSGARIG